METVRKIVKKKFDVFFLGNKSKEINPYAFFQALSMSCAYLKVEKNFEYDAKKLKFRSALFKHYCWLNIQKVINSVPIKEEYMNLEQFRCRVKNECFELNKPFLDELLKCIHEDEKILKCFFELFPEGEEKPKEIIHTDRKLGWSIGIVKKAKQILRR